MFDDLELIKLIEEAKKDIAEGKTISQEEVKKRMNYPTYKSIARIKNVSHEDNEKSGATAYLNLESKEFILHFPDSKKGNIKKLQTNEIVVLYQKINEKRYYTPLLSGIEIA